MALRLPNRRYLAAIDLVIPQPGRTQDACAVAVEISFDGSLQFGVEDILGDVGGTLLVEFVNIRKAPSEHYGMRINDVNHLGKSAPEAIQQSIHRSQGE